MGNGMEERPTLAGQCVAEVVGTFILVFFGVGSVHAAVLTGAQQGLWQVAIVWGVAISLAIYAVGAVSGAHINPAMTVAFASFRGFPWRRVPLYILSQLAGAFLAATVLYMLFSSVVVQFEAAHGLVRGMTGSELSAMVYGEYFPNPDIAQSHHWPDGVVSSLQAMLAEGLGTAFLAFFVFAVTDPRNTSGPGGRVAPLFIGLTVSILISVIAPLTQAGFNPARDFGPRLFACFAGWGPIAIPGPRGGFFMVYILSPVLGAILGGAVYEGVRAVSFSARKQSRNSQLSAIGGIFAMKKARIVFVGGFLGAGKTTLLWQAAELLIRRGTRVGLITNDQAPDLVDTKWLARKGLNVKEVAGSCFCCNLAGLIYAAEKLLAADAQVVLAEPVGSCTDLSATILQPLKDRFKEQFALAPLSVLVDPLRLAEVLSPTGDALHPDAAYIFRKQIEEADRLVVNKADLLSLQQRRQIEGTLAGQFPGAAVRYLSARTGEGIDSWLDEVLSAESAGSRIVPVDYDVYAAGEALLGWLNADIALSAAGHPVAWEELCSDLLTQLQTTFRQRNAYIGHVKLLLTTDTGHYVGNVTDATTKPFVQGQVNGTPDEAQLTLNARVEIAPDELERIVRSLLDKMEGGRVHAGVRRLQCLRPGRPRPSYRYDRVVG